jgi:membrane protease subunit HflC
MNKAFAIIVGLLLLVLLVLFSTTYTVRFHEVAEYDKRIQLVETPLVEAPTADGQSVVVRAFLMWRVDPDNVLRFAQSYPDNLSDADRPLRDHLQTAVRGGLGRYAFDELIGADSRLPQAEQDILAQLGTLSEMGVEPVTLGVSQVVLPAKTTKAVLKRMEATRSRLAEAERIKGNSDAVGIRSEAKTTVEKFQAFANQRAEEIRGLGEGMAAKFLAQMSEDEDLAIFMMNVETFKDALSGYTTYFLTDRNEPWNLLNESNDVGLSANPQASTKRQEQIATETDDEPAPEAPARQGS